SQLYSCIVCFFFFFFQAEDGIRDRNVTGVQTCALPIFFLIRLQLLSIFIVVCFSFPSFRHNPMHVHGFPTVTSLPYGMLNISAQKLSLIMTNVHASSLTFLTLQ